MLKPLETLRRLHTSSSWRNAHGVKTGGVSVRKLCDVSVSRDQMVSLCDAGKRDQVSLVWVGCESDLNRRSSKNVAANRKAATNVTASSALKQRRSLAPPRTSERSPRNAGLTTNSNLSCAAALINRNLGAAKGAVTRGERATCEYRSCQSEEVPRMVRVTRPGMAKEGFDALIADAEHLLRLASALSNSRRGKMRTELRESIGDALSVPKRERGSLDCVESRDLFVVLKPGSSLQRTHFDETELRPLLRQAIVVTATGIECLVVASAQQ